jgi:hypothetical protein
VNVTQQTLVPPFRMLRELWDAEKEFSDPTDRAVFTNSILGALACVVTEEQWESCILSAKRVMAGKIEVRHANQLANR